MHLLRFKLKSRPQKAPPSSPISSWAKFSALMALINLILVLFDTSYIPLRNFYVRQVPKLVSFYDGVKGIQPHPVTQKYLNTVDEFVRVASQVGLENSQTQQILDSLQQQSGVIMDENPFSSGAGSLTLSQIQQRISLHLGTFSAKQAFNQFWSRDYLKGAGWRSEMTFFNRQLRPLFKSNYFRLVDEYGYQVDNFWKIDSFFMAFFGLEFLIGTYLISQRFSVRSWLDAMLRRWYDVFLFLPFLRPLRLIPVGIRLHKTQLLKLDRLFVQASHEPVAPLADQMTDLVIIRIINKLQNGIRNGELSRFLLEPQHYVTVNNIDEVEVIADRIIDLTVSKALPKVQPNLEKFLHYSIESRLKSLQFYPALKKASEVGIMPKDAIENLINSLVNSLLQGLQSSYSDPQIRIFMSSLTKDFIGEMRTQLKEETTLNEIQTLLWEFLEELKLNYLVQGVKDTEETLVEAEVLRQVEEQLEEGVVPTVEPSEKI